MSDEVLWQGACELLEDGVTRVGTLYLLDDGLVYLEGGRLPKDGLTGSKALLGMAGILGFLFAITAEPDPSRTAIVARMILGLLAAGALSLSLKAGLDKRDADEKLLETLAEPIALPSASALTGLLGTAVGSFRLELDELREANPKGDRGLELRSRLDDRYSMRVRPDRDNLVALMRPRLGEGELEG